MAALELVMGLSVTCLPPQPVTRLYRDTDTDCMLHVSRIPKTRPSLDLSFCTGDWSRRSPLMGKFLLRKVRCVNEVYIRCSLQSVTDTTCRSLELFAAAIYDVRFTFFLHQRITEGWLESLCK